MKQFKVLATALAAALMVAACGGGGNGDQTPPVKYTKVVSFGDSLSDAGTYNVGAIKAAGGGMFTVNGIAGAIGADPVPSYNWTQLVSAAVIGKSSCAARIGGFGVAETAVAGCTNYAQGGSRVTDPNGNGNASGGAVAAGTLTPGPLTEPVVTQIANYVKDSGGFTGNELITVLAGPSDLLAQLAKLKADATAVGGAALATSLVTQLVAGAPPANQSAAQAFIGGAIHTEAAKATATSTSIITAAVTAATTDAVTNNYINTAVAISTTIGQTAGAAAIAAGNTYLATTGATNAGVGIVTAAATLAGYVKDMVNKGAKHVVVLNLPDISLTPSVRDTIIYNADGSIKDNSSQRLVLALANAFNAELQKDLGVTLGVPANGVLLVDFFTNMQNNVNDPGHYALTNTKDAACNLTAPANKLATTGLDDGSSLVCNASNLIAGDTSHYMFADKVSPTPYGHKLLSQVVNKIMIQAGWL